MIETIGSFAARLFGGGTKGFSGWLVTADGEVFTASDLRTVAGKKKWGEFRELVVVPPAQVFLIAEDLTFNFDRVPDFFLIPASELGNEAIDAARKVSALEAAGGDLQSRYMETLDHFFTADRFGRGEGTLGFLQNSAVDLGGEFNEHRKLEKSAREEFVALLLRIAQGESSPATETPDLSIPNDLHEKSSEGDEDEGGYYRHPDDEDDDEDDDLNRSGEYPSLDGDDDEEDEGTDSI